MLFHSNEYKVFTIFLITRTFAQLCNPLPPTVTSSCIHCGPECLLLWSTMSNTSITSSSIHSFVLTLHTNLLSGHKHISPWCTGTHTGLSGWCYLVYRTVSAISNDNEMKMNILSAATSAQPYGDIHVHSIVSHLNSLTLFDPPFSGHNTDRTGSFWCQDGHYTVCNFWNVQNVQAWSEPSLQQGSKQ